MHAVVVRVKVGDVAQAVEGLTSRVVPGVKQAPGFRSGVWVGPAEGDSGEGLSIVTFDSEQNARQAAEMVRGTQLPDTVQLVDVEVRPVTASA